MWRIRFPVLLRAARPLALAVAVLGASPLAAQAGDSASDTAEACPQFGAGFKRLPGSDTCVQMGGAVQFATGRGNAVSNAPNQGPQITPPAISPQPVPDPWKQAR